MEQLINSFNIDQKKQEKFKIYYEFLISENQKYNLTSITDVNEVYIKHFYDSCVLLNYFDLSDSTLCDVGSGAGFPGIPLKIINDSIKLTIVEPTTKRINFLKELCNKLEIKDVEFICDRAENVAKERREEFDFVTARAVSALPTLLELTIPLVRVGGSFISYKGGNYLEEVEASKNALNVLSSKVNNCFEYELPNEMGKRCLIEVKKVKKTNLVYPREYAKIKKKPL